MGTIYVEHPSITRARKQAEERDRIIHRAETWELIFELGARMAERDEQGETVMQDLRDLIHQTEEAWGQAAIERRDHRAACAQHGA